MKLLSVGLSIAFAIGCLVPTAAVAIEPTTRSASGDWPRWRGPDASGAAIDSNPPTTWSESKNVRWKVDVPGVGSSTPIVWGDRVYVSTAVKTDRVAEGRTAAAQSQPDPPRRDLENGPRPDGPRPDGPPPRGPRFGGPGFPGRGGPGPGGLGPGGPSPGGPGPGGFGGRGRGGFGGGPAPSNFYDFMVLAYDRATGAELWRTVVTSQVPHEPGHNTNNFASSSPMIDGDRLYVSFGSPGIYCLDLDGKKLWGNDLGDMQTRNQFGEGSSAAVHDGTVIVPWDHEGDSFIAALDGHTGKEKWRVGRDEVTTWSTPLITEFDGRVQVIASGTNRVRSYDLATGELIWECGGQASNPIPSPVRFEDNVIVMTGYRGYAIYSIPLSARGDITDTDLVTWYEEDAAPYVPSPVLYKGQLYFVKANNGILVSRDAKTGELLIDQTRLPEISTVYASPVAAADHIYLTARDGTTLVFAHGNTLDVIATNKLDDDIDASAAIVGNEIFLRGKTHLYCIAEASPSS